MIDIYYKIEGEHVWITNEAKEGYTLWNHSLVLCAGREATIELYNDKFILPEDSASIFYWATNTTFNDMDKWDTSNVESMRATFCSCNNLTTLDLSHFNTKKVTDMSYMFSSSPNLTNLDLLAFNTKSLTNMEYMFSNCSALTEVNLWRFVTKRVTKMKNLFYGCSSLRKVWVSNRWTTENVEDDMSDMFYGCENIKGEQGTTYNPYHIDQSYARLDLDGQPGYFWEYEYKLYYDIDEGGVLHYCNEPARPGYTKFCQTRTGDRPLSYGRQVVIDLTNDEFVFPTWVHKVNQSTGIETNVRDTFFDYFFKCTNTTFNDIDKWDTSHIEEFGGFFRSSLQLERIDITSFDTDAAKSMSGIFNGCEALGFCDLSQFNTENLATEGSHTGNGFESIFAGCSNLTTVVLPPMLSPNSYSASWAFYNCSKLTEIYAPAGTDWAEWINIPEGYSNSIFYNCTSLPNWDGVVDETRANNTTPNGYFGITPYIMTKHTVYEKIDGTWSAVTVLQKQSDAWVGHEVYA